MKVRVQVIKEELNLYNEQVKFPRFLLRLSGGEELRQVLNLSFRLLTGEVVLQFLGK